VGLLDGNCVGPSMFVMMVGVGFSVLVKRCSFSRFWLGFWVGVVFVPMG
jgi:Ca2+/Na+ antiporter